MAAVGGRLVLLGGRGQPRTNILDPQTCTLTKGAAAPSQTHHFQAVTVGQEVYVIGAFTGNFPNETGLPNVRIYNPQTDQWREGPPIPAARQRGAAAAALHEGWIYLAGGIINGHSSGNVAWLDRFNPATGAWEILADAPRARDHAAAAVVEGKLVLVGGRRTSAANTFGLTVPEVDLYDLAAQTWSTAPNPIPRQRAGMGAVVMARQVLAIGGESTAMTAAHAETEAFDPAGGAWLRLSALREGRHGMGAAVIESSAYVGSGTPVRGGGQDLANFERFGLTSGPCD